MVRRSQYRSPQNWQTSVRTGTHLSFPRKRESIRPPDVLLHVLEHHVFAVTDNAGANDLVPVHLDPRLFVEKSTTPIVTELVNGR